MRGRGQENQHQRTVAGGSREVPKVGIDYMWMGKRDEEIGMPILAGGDQE